jgi:hypothetical protein
VAIFSGEPDQIIAQELVVAFFIVPKRLCTK